MECKVVTEIPLLVQKIFQHAEAFVWIRPCTDMPFYKNIKISYRTAIKHGSRSASQTGNSLRWSVK